MYSIVQRFCQFLRKLRIRILGKVQKKILRPVLKKKIFNNLPHSFQVLVQSFQKVLLEPKKIVLKNIKKGIRKRRILC